jgi:hypothetical protein
MQKIKAGMDYTKATQQQMLLEKALYVIHA